MSIDFNKFVAITSGVGGAVVATARELIGRLFTSNILLPTETIVEFTSAADVGVFFGTTSQEFLRALFYFGFISKLSTTPKKISFARWAPAATAPLIIGDSAVFAIGTFTPISDGAFTLTLGGDTEIITGLDFTTDVSLADVASTIETGIQAANVAAVWTAATVTFNAVDSRFDFVGGDTGPFVISVAPAGSGTEIVPLVGWELGARFSNGVAAETVTDVLIASTSLSNNFGSFAFIAAITQDEALLIAQFNDTQNVRFIFCLSVLQADAQSFFDDLSAISGTAMTLLDPATTNEYPEMAPMLVFAATPYERRAAVQNYMFQQFALTPSVTETTLSDTLDAIRTNYYGQTQQAGTDISFYQRAFMMGGATDPIDMGVYANEVWLKDDAGVRLINLLLALSAISANDTGRGQVLGAVQATIEQATLNGTISVGKDLNDTQIAFITQVTDDPNAFIQIQTIGYWIDATVEEVGPGDFKIVYLLLYSKNDTVRKVEGTHTLI